MLYRPDDPLITWLRDGHLGGIKPGCRREEVAEKWGEPILHLGCVWAYGFPQRESDTILQSIWDDQTDRLQELQLRLGDSDSLHFPESFGSVPFVFSHKTSEQEFLDWILCHGIDVRPMPMQLNVWAQWMVIGSHGMRVVFLRGLMFCIYQPDRDHF